MDNLINHVMKVAKNDARTFLAPFVGAYRALKNEANRPPVDSQPFNKQQVEHKS